MIVLKIFTAVPLVAALLYTVMGLSLFISECRYNGTKNDKKSCIHTKIDCENCISQTGCPLKDNNSIS